MSPIEINLEDISAPNVWEVNGQSPANSPRAVIEFAQMLLPLAQNPVSGIQIYPLVKALVANGPLKNFKGIQISEDELAQRLAPSPLQQPGAMVGAPDPTGGVPGLPGAPEGPGGAQAPLG